MQSALALSRLTWAGGKLRICRSLDQHHRRDWAGKEAHFFNDWHLLGARIDLLAGDTSEAAKACCVNFSLQDQASFALRSLEIFSPSASPLNTVLVAGGQGGVFQLRRPGAAGGSWSRVGTGIPTGGLTFNVRYNYACDVLSAGIVGRGAWTVSGAFRGASTAGCPPVPPSVAPAILPTGLRVRPIASPPPVALIVNDTP